MSEHDIEYAVFDALRREAIARLFGESDGGKFTTEKYADSYSRVTSKEAGRRGVDRFPPIETKLARGHLEDCDFVIAIGEDEWLTTDSREAGQSDD